ncbi:Peptidoglycan/LPS O-acetylase OafA/YrhL, contains acyltransferase and SGNH-hydrolase domains [Azospirillum lipoferum]|nr:Peptidoglycan/LPS O-acetylase OafA/YrhL, contains acyltransferase and SGNH-hydrolase domains [Azospirillum lipoferum]
MATANGVNYRVNNFDFIRLCAATFVIISHAFALNGSNYDPYSAWAVHGTLSGVGVGAFFTVSGLLVTRSWDGDPNPFRFAMRRILRIIPGLVVLTLLCAFVLGPLVTSLSRDEYFASPQTLGYLNNILIFPLQYGLPGVFTNLPIAGVVNGSLWTLAVEVTMYAGVAILGSLGLLRWRCTPVILFLGFATAHVVLQKLHPQPIFWLWMDIHTILDCGAYFFAGASLYKFDAAIPRLPSRLFALLLLFVASMGTPMVLIVSYFALPYLVFCIAFEDNALLRKVSHTGDLSYGAYIYAFPAQQLVVHLFGTAMGPVLSMMLTALLTFPLAALSWFLIERPMLRLKPAARRKDVVSPEPVPAMAISMAISMAAPLPSPGVAKASVRTSGGDAGAATTAAIAGAAQ